MKKSKRHSRKPKINPDKPIPFSLTTRGRWALALATLSLGGES